MGLRLTVRAEEGRQIPVAAVIELGHVATRHHLVIDYEPILRPVLNANLRIFLREFVADDSGKRRIILGLPKNAFYTFAPKQPNAASRLFSALNQWAEAESLSSIHCMRASDGQEYDVIDERVLVAAMLQVKSGGKIPGIADVGTVLLDEIEKITTHHYEVLDGQWEDILTS